MKNEYLRHIIATIQYRFNKSVIQAGDDFGKFSPGKGSRNPNEIINHMYTVLKATRLFIEKNKLLNETQEKLDTSGEINRFKKELYRIDKSLSDKEIGINYTKRLLQGPFSDILTHIGQISMLQRLYGNPIKGEDFSSAPIVAGLILPDTSF